jgi:FixJ family two-component response regulator
MNILFVDDELENNLAEVYKSVQDFFANRGDKVIKKLSGPQALHFLDTDDNALDVDIAILDQAITDDMTGQELGAVINDRFPHIALVMLTGRGDWQTKFELCQQLMRIGFCDFIDKASFKSAQIFSHLERIVNLPSVQAKQKLKLRLTNIEDYLRHLGGEINQAKKIHFLENFDDLVVKPGKLEEILANLDAQEEILAFSEAKKITVNRACLGAGIFLHTTGVPITKKASKRTEVSG